MRRFSWITYTLALWLGTASCTGGGTEQPASATVDGATEQGGGQGVEEVTLTFWHSVPDPYIPVLEQFMAEYSRTRPDVEVVLEHYGAQDVAIRKLQLALALEQRPDLVWLAPPYTAELAEAGVIRPVEEFILRDPSFDPSDIRSLYWQGATYKGVRCTLPLDANLLAIFYNKRMFREAGITGPPRTWDELVEVARHLTRDRDGDGQIDQYGLQIPFGSQEWVVWIWQTFLWQAGGEFLDEKRTAARFHAAPGKEALQFWIDLVYEERVATLSEENDWTADALLNGRVAMLINGPWLIPSLDSLANFEYGVFPLPAKKRLATNIGGQNLFFIRTTPERERAAWELAKALVHPAFQVEYARQTGFFPVSRSAESHPRFQAYLRTHPVYATFYAQLEHGHVRPTVPAYFAVSHVVGEALRSALSQEVVPAVALHEAAARVDLILQSTETAAATR